MPMQDAGTGPAGALMLPVRLSSERVRQAVRQDCFFAKKQASPVALLIVAHTRRTDVAPKTAFRSRNAIARDMTVFAAEASANHVGRLWKARP